MCNSSIFNDGKQYITKSNPVIIKTTITIIMIIRIITSVVVIIINYNYN